MLPRPSISERLRALQARWNDLHWPSELRQSHLIRATVPQAARCLRRELWVVVASRYYDARGGELRQLLRVIEPSDALERQRAIHQGEVVTARRDVRAVGISQAITARHRSDVYRPRSERSRQIGRSAEKSAHRNTPRRAAKEAWHSALEKLTPGAQQRTPREQCSCRVESDRPHSHRSVKQRSVVEPLDTGRSDESI